MNTRSKSASAQMAIASAPLSEAPFLVGTAISVWQNSGGEPTNWATWAAKRNILGMSTIKGGDKPDHSCNFWENYETDLQRNVAMGCTSMRFSLEWHRIEPERGQISSDAIAHFHKILDVMDKLGITPLATLHHFVHPQWFEDLGAFEKEENIPLYLTWVELAYREFGPRIRSWSTFNEPGVFAFSGYVFGSFPPGKFLATQLAGLVVKHMLIAHDKAYHLIKSLPSGNMSEVGLVHNEMRFEPYRGDWLTKYALHTHALCYMFDTCWGNEPITQYLINGHFVWRPLGPAFPVEYRNPAGTPPGDYVGLNYYSRMVIDWKLALVCYPGEVMTDMNNALYPDGFYQIMSQAIKRHARIGKPIIITETGIADGVDTRRELWATSYLKALEAAIADGLDVRGLMYWTLVDNFEWAFGYHAKFGLFAWNPTMGPAERQERPSGKLIKRLFKALPGRVKKLREGGLAALRELRQADEDEAKAEAKLPNDVEDETEQLVKDAFVLA